MVDPRVECVRDVLMRAHADGCPVAHPSEEVARIAVRRWDSFANRRVKESNRAGRIDDLTQGLIAYLEANPRLVDPLKADYEYLATLIVDALTARSASNAPALLIEGFAADELPDALGMEFEADLVTGRTVVARVGTAEILMALRVHGDSLIAELAHVDRGGEGVLPALLGAIIRLARRRQLKAVEWHVFAATCARPNPRLRPVLERAGFVIRDVPEGTKHYYRRDSVLAK